MTDADKLRDYTNSLDNDRELPTWIEDLTADLRRIASLLDAVPPETLEAIRAGTWVAVPREPTKDMIWAGGRAIWQNINGVNPVPENGLHITIWPAGTETHALIGYRAALAAAPRKPEVSK